MIGLTHLEIRRRLLRTTLHSLAPALLAVVMAGSANAQDSEPPALVGRISAITGPVSMQRSDSQDWIDAGVNEPVTIGDAVYAPEGADARIQIGATDLDLKSDSEIDIAALDDNAGTIRLDSGSLDVRVSALPTADGLSIATPRGTVRLTEPGIYNIDAGTEDEPTHVTAWNGSARLGDSATAVTVQQGQTLVITGTADAPQYAYNSDIGEPPREWRTPPRVVQARETERYVAPEMTGAEDLYDYGSFETAADYGTVWYPRDVPVDWQPYRYGHWEYVAPWGQTWIDDRPWGFAPFHYGRWAHIGNRWGWCPGQYVRHPVYAPALVAFVGGGGFSAAISFGGRGGGAVGWVPLAPGEGYRPPYRVSQTYIQNINRTTIVNKTVINNYGPGQGQRGLGRGFGPNAQPQTVAGFANRRFATVVPADVVGRARPVAAAAVQVHPEALERAQVNAEAVRAIKPIPAAERPATRPGPIARPANPRTAVNARPALPPARGRGAGGPNRPNAQQAAPAVPAARPGQPPAPNALRPEANQPAAATPPAGRPDNRPAAEPRPAPGPRPAPVPPRGRPAMDKPEAPKPDVVKPEAPKPEVVRPQNNRPAMTRPEGRPAVEPTRPPRPEARPAPAAPRPEVQQQARPPRPQIAPRPQPQAAPRPEPRPQPAPRPQPQQQQQRPQAQPPRPQPQPQPRPQPLAQQQRPAPQQQHPAQGKKPDDK